MTIRSALFLLAAAAGLAACASAPLPGPSRAASGPVCIDLYQRFDVLERTFSSPPRRRDQMIAHPVVMAQAGRIRRAGCLTFTREIAGMEAVAGPGVTDAGLLIRPVALHVGVVTNMEDDARARAFFEARGAAARSVGSAALGRRVYLGPFRTQGGLDTARDLALRAGFSAPYPARF